MWQSDCLLSTIFDCMKRPELPTAVGRVIVMVFVQSIVEVKEVAVKFADFAV
jgi:hypothetical protein